MVKYEGYAETLKSGLKTEPVETTLTDRVTTQRVAYLDSPVKISE